MSGTDFQKCFEKQSISLLVLPLCQVYEEKGYEEQDLKQGKINNFANITITIQSDKHDLEKVNGVGEIIIDAPDEPVQSDEESEQPTSKTPLLENGEKHQENEPIAHNEEEESLETNAIHERI